MGQGISTTQFFLYGKQHFTKTGYLKHAAKYAANEALDKADLSGKVFVVTGANSGIGHEMAKFLFRQKGRVYMVCRDSSRAENARADVLSGWSAGQGEESAAAEKRLVTVIADCSLRSDILKVAETIGRMEPGGVDALVCNAGALLEKRAVTQEGHETTFACHLLYGAYGLAKVMEPSLRACAAHGGAPRCIFVTSGGMYNTKWPKWEIGSSSSAADGGNTPKYDGMMAYCYCKRAQVILAEEWARAEQAAAAAGGTSTSPIQYVSAHPGWSATPGVDAAFGSKAKWLEPMRNLWEGAEGICWLCTAPATQIEPGALYLDRTPQRKHLAGPFFTEGSYTKNSRAEIEDLLSRLACTAALPGDPGEQPAAN